MLAFETPLANSEDFEIPQCVANGDEAVALIREHQANRMLKREAKGNAG
jgi:hypothetical protein